MIDSYYNFSDALNGRETYVRGLRSAAHIREVGSMEYFGLKATNASAGQQARPNADSLEARDEVLTQVRTSILTLLPEPFLRAFCTQQDCLP